MPCSKDVHDFAAVIGWNTCPICDQTLEDPSKEAWLKCGRYHEWPHSKIDTTPAGTWGEGELS